MLGPANTMRTLPMIALMLLSLTGCNYFTARVDSIGLREYQDDTSIAQVKSGKIRAEYYDIIEEQWGHSMWSEKRNGANLGSMTYNSTDPKFAPFLFSLHIEWPHCSSIIS